MDHPARNTKAAIVAVLSVFSGAGFFFGASWTIGFVSELLESDHSLGFTLWYYVPWLAGTYGACLMCSLILIWCLRRWRLLP